MVVLAVCAVVLAVMASGAPQCCDAEAYVQEGRDLLTGGWSSGWLMPVHNYAYPLFLALLQVAGVQGRLGIAVAQVGLLLLAAGILGVTLARVTRTPASRAVAATLAIALLPAAAWSGYSLSEGLAAPVLFLLLAATISAGDRLDSGRAALLASVVLGLVAGLSWMVRPGLLWVPIVVGAMACCVAVVVARRGRSYAPLLPILFAVGVAIVAVPQWSLAGDPLKLGFAAAQSHWSEIIWRYATNLSGCGPAPLMFSPLTENLQDVQTSAVAAPADLPWRAATLVAHLVSGWDALPSPTYVVSLHDHRWLLVTAASGFVILGPVLAGGLLWSRFRARASLTPEVAALGALLLIFAASEAALSMTATEFRYNLPGWLAAGACLAFLTASGWWTRARIRLLLVGGVLVSGAVYAIGQMTLDYSTFWLRCTN